MRNDKIDIDGDQVHLDPKNLEFSDSTLTIYLQKEGGYYNNFGGYLARAEHNLMQSEITLEALHGQKFRDYKDEGGSDKYAEGRTESDEDVVDAKKAVADAKFRVRLLTQHLKAWDKNHENAQSLGHFLRKEMDKLGTDVIRQTNTDGPHNYHDDIDGDIEKIVKPIG